MAAPGGRRTQHIATYLSWPEADGWEALRAADSHRAGAPLSRADWLLRIVEPGLRAAADDDALPTYHRDRCRRALQALADERIHRPRRAPGRPPNVY